MHSSRAVATGAGMMAAALARDGEICLGYKLGAHDHDPEENYGVRLIPPKNEQKCLTKFSVFFIPKERIKLVY